MKFERILEDVIGFGRYQFLLCFMVSWYGIPSGTNVIGAVFQSYNLKHWCFIKEPSEDCAINSTNRFDFIPFNNETHGFRSCVRYGFQKINASICEVNRSVEVPCDNGYEYDRTLFSETVVSEFNLVCGRSIIKSISTSLYMLGIFFSAMLTSNLCDRYGRRPVMTITSIGSLIIVIAESYLTSAPLFCVFRFLLGFFSSAVTLSTFVYILEITPMDWRAKVGMASQAFFAAGCIAMSGVAYFFRNWRENLRFTAVFYVPFMVFLFFIPESPRWLFATKKYDRARKITLDIIRKNNSVCSRGNLDDVDENEQRICEQYNDKAKFVTKEPDEENESPERYTTLDLFRTAAIRRITFVMMYIWFVDSFVFYGISLNAGSLTGDLFINNALNGVMQFGGYALCFFIMDGVGRRRLLAIAMLISGSGLAISTVIKITSSADSAWSTLGLITAFLAKFGISAAYAVTYNYTSELYPTVVRACGVGTGSMAARVGGVLAPFVIGLQDYYSWMPNTIFALTAILATIVSLLCLPETTRHGMNETIEEAERFYKQN